MEARSYRKNAFEPVTRALADAWLQVRAKPLVYLLIWLSLALAPYIVLGLLFSKPLLEAFDAFMAATENMGTAVTASAALPADFVSASLRIFGVYSVILVIISLFAVYMGAVLSGTIRRFRSSTFPRYLEAMNDGIGIFPGFFLSVLYTLMKILVRPLSAGLLGAALAFAFKQPAVWTFAFFVGMFLFLSDLYKFGLAPFVHLSLGVPAGDACRISRAYHQSQRPVVASLFLVLLLLPFIVLSMIFMLFLSAGWYFGGGSLVLWFLQSAVQFSIVMTLINFAMNIFRNPVPEPEESPQGTD